MLSLCMPSFVVRLDRAVGNSAGRLSISSIFLLISYSYLINIIVLQ